MALSRVFVHAMGIAVLAVVAACSPAAQQPAAQPAQPAAEPAKAAAPAQPAKPAAAQPAKPAAAQPAVKPAAPAVQKPAEKPAASAPAPAKAPQEMIDAANKEGELRILWTGTATDQWRQRFQDAFNEHYGTKVTIADTRSSNYVRDTAAVIAETAAGQKPSWDLMTVTDAHYGDLAKAGLLGQHKWTELFGVPARAIMFNGGAYMFAHQLVQPAYNSDAVKGNDIPRTWDAFVDPKWKGKVGVPSGTHVWARLSKAWGDEKTTQYIERLAAQGPRLGSFADLNQSLQLGEIHLLTSQLDNIMRVNLSRKAPVATADDVQPIVAQGLGLGPIKDARSPNAALLFAGFLASEKGRALWIEFQGQSSVFAEGTPTWKYVQGKEVATLDEEFLAKEMGPRTAKYGRAIGYR